MLVFGERGGQLRVPREFLFRAAIITIGVSYLLHNSNLLLQCPVSSHSCRFTCDIEGRFSLLVRFSVTGARAAVVGFGRQDSWVGCK